jgi:hypothetical protein
MQSPPLVLTVIPASSLAHSTLPTSELTALQDKSLQMSYFNALSQDCPKGSETNDSDNTNNTDQLR